MTTFYVYTLSDPASGEVFYVGKGQKARAWQHVISVRNGRRGCNAAKEQRISEILATGSVPVVLIAHRFELEQDALDTEADMIAAGVGLTNIMAGAGKAMTPEVAKARMDARQARIDASALEKTRSFLADFLARASKWPDVTFPGIKDGDQKAREFLAGLKEMLSTVDVCREKSIHG